MNGGGHTACHIPVHTCLAVFDVVSRYHGFKAQTGDTTSTECFAWSNSVWKPTERGRWALPSAGKERSSGIFSTSLMLKLTRVFSFWSPKGEPKSLKIFYECICEKNCIEQLLSPRTGVQNLTNVLEWCHWGSIGWQWRVWVSEWNNVSLKSQREVQVSSCYNNMCKSVGNSAALWVMQSPVPKKKNKKEISLTDNHSG